MQHRWTAGRAGRSSLAPMFAGEVRAEAHLPLTDKACLRGEAEAAGAASADQPHRGLKGPRECLQFTLAFDRRAGQPTGHRCSLG